MLKLFIDIIEGPSTLTIQTSIAVNTNTLHKPGKNVVVVYYQSVYTI